MASFSPELFLRVRGRDALTAPIKGTAPRTGDDGAARLRASAKDAAENIMITDLMRNDLSRVCRPGSVRVEELLSVQPHPGVWHLVSTVRGTLTEPTTTADLLAATFPPGSVTGAPKLAAQRAIAELEVEPRGAYTGSIGLVSPCAGTDLNVIIRSFEIRPGGLEGPSPGIEPSRAGSSSASAAGSPPTACRSGSGTSACTRRRRWSLPPAPSSTRCWPTSPNRPPPSCWRPACSSRCWSSAGSSSDWPATWLGWTGPAGSSTVPACRPTSPTGCGAGTISMRRSGSRCASRCGPGTAAWRSPSGLGCWVPDRRPAPCGAGNGRLGPGDTSGWTGRD